MTDIEFTERFKKYPGLGANFERMLFLVENTEDEITRKASVFLVVAELAKNPPKIENSYSKTLLF